MLLDVFFSPSVYWSKRVSSSWSCVLVLDPVYCLALLVYQHPSLYTALRYTADCRSPRHAYHPSIWRCPWCIPGPSLCICVCVIKWHSSFSDPSESLWPLSHQRLVTVVGATGKEFKDCLRSCPEAAGAHAEGQPSAIAMHELLDVSEQAWDVHHYIHSLNPYKDSRHWISGCTMHICTKPL